MANMHILSKVNRTIVNANHFIDKLKDGLDEEVRERGNNFSAGQRQLLSFARTIIHKPAVMILDEATAALDTETEKLIQDALKAIAWNAREATMPEDLCYLYGTYLED